jgi:hypothetical protein
MPEKLVSIYTKATSLRQNSGKQVSKDPKKEGKVAEEKLAVRRTNKWEISPL